MRQRKRPRFSAGSARGIAGFVQDVYRLVDLAAVRLLDGETLAVVLFAANPGRGAVFFAAFVVFFGVLEALAVVLFAANPGRGAGIFVDFAVFFALLEAFDEFATPPLFCLASSFATTEGCFVFFAQAIAVS